MLLTDGYIYFLSRSAINLYSNGFALSSIWVPAAGYALRLFLSYCWLQFRRLSTSCGIFYPATDPSSGGTIWVAADSIAVLIAVLYFDFPWIFVVFNPFFPEFNYRKSVCCLLSIGRIFDEKMSFHDFFLSEFSKRKKSLHWQLQFHICFVSHYFSWTKYQDKS